MFGKGAGGRKSCGKIRLKGGMVHPKRGGTTKLGGPGQTGDTGTSLE